MKATRKSRMPWPQCRKRVNLLSPPDAHERAGKKTGQAFVLVLVCFDLRTGTLPVLFLSSRQRLVIAHWQLPISDWCLAIGPIGNRQSKIGKIGTHPLHY